MYRYTPTNWWTGYTCKNYMIVLIEGPREFPLNFRRSESIDENPLDLSVHSSAAASELYEWFLGDDFGLFLQSNITTYYLGIYLIYSDIGN